MANVLIVRYSSLGDTLILVPVVYDLAKKYPNDSFYVLTYHSLSYLYNLMPSNVVFIPMVTRKRLGLFRGLNYLWDRRKMLNSIITRYNFDKIVFLRRGSIETTLEKAYPNAEIAYINSEYFNSRQRIESKSCDGLTASNLYIDTLNRVGYPDIIPSFDSNYFKTLKIDSVLEELGLTQNASFIAIAPFSRMPMKEYALEKIIEIIAYYHSNSSIRILLLGGGKLEENKCEAIESKFSNVRSTVGKYSMEVELCLLAKARAVLTMDSANLHLASFVTTSVVSIWGSNDPSLGFYPANIPIDYAIQKELDCRPCSLFGESECTNSQKLECMDIDAGLIIKKIDTFLEDRLV